MRPENQDYTAVSFQFKNQPCGAPPRPLFLALASGLSVSPDYGSDRSLAKLQALSGAEGPTEAGYG
jgi:hypothetical protein